MGQWNIDTDLLFKNFAHFAEWETDEERPCGGACFGRQGEVHLVIFTHGIADAQFHYILATLSADLTYIGHVVVDGHHSVGGLPSSGITIEVERSTLRDKDTDALLAKNPFLVQASIPPAQAFVSTTVSLDLLLRKGCEMDDLSVCSDRVDGVVDSLSFLIGTSLLSSNMPGPSPLGKNPSKHTTIASFQSLTPPPNDDEQDVFVPIVRITKMESAQEVAVSLEVTVPVYGADTAKELHDRLIDGVRRRAQLCCAQYADAIRSGDDVCDMSSVCFLPSGWSRPLHLQVPSVPADPIAFRRHHHRLLNLPRSFPVLRMGQSIQWKEGPGRIRDIHTHVSNYKQKGELAFVKNGYDYYHYMQDGFDDNGWGCAYRSLQTIVSWFANNGLTSMSVPSHRQIQEYLVDLGDQPPSFIGSRKWIGSTEIGMVLTKFGFDSRFLTTNSGAEVNEKGRDLLYHFRRVGTPVMIGGGQLAHTIIGVDVDMDTDDTMFLILDPHYTGRDDIGPAIKGGCYWKPASFWNKGDFYNLILPLVPKETDI